MKNSSTIITNSFPRSLIIKALPARGGENTALPHNPPHPPRQSRQWRRPSPAGKREDSRNQGRECADPTAPCRHGRPPGPTRAARTLAGNVPLLSALFPLGSPRPNSFNFKYGKITKEM